MQVLEADNYQNMICLFAKLYQINRASILKHITLTCQNCIDNITKGLVHGKHCINRIICNQI